MGENQSNESVFLSLYLESRALSSGHSQVHIKHEGKELCEELKMA